MVTELPGTQPKPLPIFSATKLATYLDCPKKYQYTYIDRFEDGLASIWALSGSHVHKAIETIHAQGETFNPLAYYQRELSQALSTDEVIVGSEHAASVMSAALGMLRLYTQQPNKEVRASEKIFLLPYPNKESPLCMIRGIMDQVFDWGIVDFKTSARAPSKKKLSTNIQFIIYAWAFEQLYHKKPEHIYWHHLRTGKQIEADVVNDAALGVLAHVIQTVLEDTTYERRWQTPPCRYCPFYNRCEESV